MRVEQAPNFPTMVAHDILLNKKPSVQCDLEMTCYVRLDQSKKIQMDYNVAVMMKTPKAATYIIGRILQDIDFWEGLYEYPGTKITPSGRAEPIYLHYDPLPKLDNRYGNDTAAGTDNANSIFCIGEMGSSDDWAWCLEGYKNKKQQWIQIETSRRVVVGSHTMLVTKPTSSMAWHRQQIWGMWHASGDTVMEKNWFCFEIHRLDDTLVHSNYKI